MPALPLLSPPNRHLLQGEQAGTIFPPSLDDLAAQALAQHGPPGVMVNEDYEIVHLARGAGRFLQFADGSPSPQLLRVLHPELRLELRASLYQAQQEDRRIVTRPVRLQLAGLLRHVSATIQPLADPAWARGHLLILFHELPDSGEGVRRAIRSRWSTS